MHEGRESLRATARFIVKSNKLPTIQADLLIKVENGKMNVK